MNAHKLPEPANKPAQTAKPRRISARVRTAIRLRVEKGLTGEEAAKVAGLSSAGFWKAWTQPHVQALYAELKAQYIQRVTDRRDLLKARALEVAEELLTSAQSEAVKARMVEFLAGEAKAPLVAIQNIAAPIAGYSYRKPDNATGADAGQPVEIEGKAHPVVKGD